MIGRLLGYGKKEDQKANDHYCKGEYEDALECYKKALSYNPESVVCHCNIGFVLSKLGLNLEAIKSFDEALRLDAKNVNAHIGIGDARCGLAQDGRAVMSYDAALRLDAKNVQAHTGKVIALFNLGKYEKAMESYDLVLQLDSKNVDIRMGMGIALFDLGDYEKAIESYNAVLQLDAKNVQAHICKVRAFGRLDRYEQEIESYDAILQLDPKNAIAHLNKGHIFYKQLSRYEQAVESYDAALRLDANNLSACIGRGDALLGLAQFEKAEESYDAALRLKTKSVRANIGKGNIFYQQKKYKEAFSSFTHCANPSVSINDFLTSNHKKNPFYLPLFLGQSASKAQRLVQLKLYLVALEEFKKAEKLANKETAKLFIHDQINLLIKWGEWLSLQQQPELALEKFQEASRLLSSDIQEQKIPASESKELVFIASPLKEFVLNTLLGQGAACLALGRWDDARSYYEKILDHHSNHLLALHHLGLIHRYLCHFKDSIRCYEAALKVNPDHNPTHFNLACVLLIDKNKERARAEYKIFQQKQVYAPASSETIDCYYDLATDFQDSKDPLAWVLQEKATQLLQNRNKQIVQRVQHEHEQLAKENAMQEKLLLQSVPEEKETKEVKQEEKEMKEEKRSSAFKEKLKQEELLGQQFLEAAKQKDLIKLKQLKAQGANILACDIDGNNGLHLAVIAGADISILAFFVVGEKIVDIDVANEKGETALVLAVQRGDAAAVKFLVKKRAGLYYKHTDTVNRKTQKHVMAAAMETKQSVEVVEFLLDHVDARHDPVSPLHLAAVEGHGEVIRFLVTQRKIDVNVPDEKGLTAVMNAALEKKSDTVAFLLDELKAEFDDKDFLERVSDKVIKNKLKQHLREHHNPEDKLTNAIFLALFKDNYECSVGDEKAQGEYNTLKTLIALTLRVTSPTAVLKRLNLDRQSLRQFQASKEGKQFTTFIQHQFAGKAKTRKDWQRVLDSKQRQICTALDVYCQLSTHVDVVLDNIASEAIEVTGANSKDELIKPFHSCIKNVLRTLLVAADKKSGKEEKKIECKEEKKDEHEEDQVSEQLKTSSELFALFEEQGSQLIVLLKEQVNQVVNDGNLINENHKDIYRRRIVAAVDTWLYRNHCLNQREEKAHELAHQLVSKLKEHTRLIKEGQMKHKKECLAYAVIKKSFNVPVVAFDNCSVLDYLVKNPGDEENLITRLFSKLKDERLKEFTSKFKNQKSYKEKVTAVIQCCANDLIRDKQHSVSRRSMLFTGEEEGKGGLTENQIYFIDKLSAHFYLIYGQFESLNAGLVRRLEGTADKIAQLVQEHKDALPKINLIFAEIQLGEVVNAIAKVGVYLTNLTVANAAERMTRLFKVYNFRERCELMDAAGKFIVMRYRTQIEKLATDGLDQLAKCVSDRAIQYITACDEHLIASRPTLWHKFKKFVWDGKYVPSKIQQPKEPLEVLITGMLEATSCRDDEPIKTKNGATWTPKGIINGGGIVVVDGASKPRYYSHKILEKDSTGSPLFEYCYGSQQEVEKGGFKLVETGAQPVFSPTHLSNQTRIRPAALGRPMR